ncbi:glutamate synthase central domain-containing protein, partial [Escherichia coli]
RFEMLYAPVFDTGEANEAALREAIDGLCAEVAAFAAGEGGIAVITDRHVSARRAALPMIMVVSAINQRLIEEGLRLRVSLIVE